MKIGVVTTSYPRFVGDHAGNFVGAQVEALRALGHDVDVVSGDPRHALFTSAGAPDALERGGVATYAAAASFTVSQTRAVASRVATWDLAIAHWLAPSALTTMIARATAPRRIPLLAIAHGGDIHTLRRLHVLGPALRLLHAANARLVFVSSELRDLAKQAAPRLAGWLDGALVQPMGIDVARFTAIRAARMADAARASAEPASTVPASAEPKVLVVARLVPVKGVDIAIRAMQHVRGRVCLVVAGDGPERARLEALAAPQPVDWCGRVDADRRDALLREAACVVIPSRVLANGRSEGTPMIALEALASGVPVIASDVGGLRDLPGITRVPPDDPHALAVAIARVIETAALVAVDGVRFDHRHITARLLDYARAHVAPCGSDISEMTDDCEPGDSIRRRTA